MSDFNKLFYTIDEAAEKYVDTDSQAAQGFK